jgi:hypothetical protein
MDGHNLPTRHRIYLLSVWREGGEFETCQPTALEKTMLETPGDIKREEVL